MIECVLWILWGVWMFGALCSAVVVGGYVRRMRREDQQWASVGRDQQKPVALILPVKGLDPERSDCFFGALLNQDYSHFRLLVTVADESDPAIAWLRDHLELGPDETVWVTGDEGGAGLTEVRLIVAGPSQESGQKVHNQLAALERLNADDEIVAFADADIHIGPDWLARLVAPINSGSCELATTYRWLIPERSTLPNLMASVINASVATLAGWDAWNILWGGSMAIARRDFEDMDVRGLLRGSLNDDLRLSRVARRSGRKIGFVRSLLVPTPIDYDWTSFFEFGRRQYYQVRHFLPRLYRWANLLTWIYTIGFLSSLSAIVFFHYQAAWLAVGFVFACDQARAFFRMRTIRILYGDDPARWKKLKKTSWIEHLATPFWMLIHTSLMTGALFMDRIRWAGIEYRFVSREETEILTK